MPPGICFIRLFGSAILAGHPSDPVAHNNGMPAIFGSRHIEQNGTSLGGGDPGILRIAADADIHHAVITDDNHLLPHAPALWGLSVVHAQSDQTAYAAISGFNPEFANL